jgi:hypothetical protein
MVPTMRTTLLAALLLASPLAMGAATATHAQCGSPTNTVALDPVTLYVWGPGSPCKGASVDVSGNINCPNGQDVGIAGVANVAYCSRRDPSQGSASPRDIVGVWLHP